MARTQSVYYRAPDGSEPVDEFIECLDERVQPTIDLQIDRLNDRPATAPPLRFPHTSQLRCHYGSALYRILYRRSGNLVILLHMLRKDTAAIPEADIAIAEERWADFKRKMDAPKRQPPRAGHDAA